MRATPQQIKRAYQNTVTESDLLTDSDDTKRGFIAGFRLYERMANAFGLALTPDQISQFKGMKDPL